MFLNENISYGLAMSQSLSVGDFQGETNIETPQHTIQNRLIEKSIQYILEVDKDYKKELPQDHNKLINGSICLQL